MAGGVPVQHDPGGSAQVEQNIDIGAVSQVCRDTVESTSVTRLASAVPLRGLASGSGRVESACFSAIRRSLGRQSFTPDAIDRILRSRQASTLNVYDKKWHVFAAWCMSRDEDPVYLEPSVMCDFFLFLFEINKFQPITIMGYHSAIARVYRLCDLYDPGKDVVISALIENFQITKPRKTTLFPK